ncbi:MAG: peptidylprolyl isomerase [Candidatus Andersenbacteria bacterium]|nr:peptidylprolyl isomerase [bacterium]MDZ4225273.1 peptidylprolyl isomerase [Candidatus Andersenbacteria bacterium]
MSYTPYILVIILVLIAAGGYIYLTRPFSEPNLSLEKPTVTPSMIDDTIQLPPLRQDSAGQAATPEPSANSNSSGLSVEQGDALATPDGAPFTPVNEIVTATIKTSMGDITLKLDGTKAPLAVGNFVALAKKGFYDGTSFHRVIPDFMIQGGDPLSKDSAARAQQGTGGPGYQFPNEDNDRKFVRGAIGMANSGRDTNGSQFFIMVADMPQLDGGYTNFGEVTSGMDVADKISLVERDAWDNPLQPVTIQQVIVGE